LQSPRQQFLNLIKNIVANNPARASETKPVHAPPKLACSGNFKPRRETAEQRRQRKLQAERNRIANMPKPKLIEKHFKVPSLDEIELKRIEQTPRDRHVVRDRKSSGRLRRSA
jgi:hypothetical protein